MLSWRSANNRINVVAFICEVQSSFLVCSSFLLVYLYIDATAAYGNMLETTQDLATNLFRGSLLSGVTILMTLVLEWFCRDDVKRFVVNRSLIDLSPISMGERIFLIAGVVFWEGLMYTLIHKAFHEVPGLYRFHKFHHQFNDIVLPSSANAVSIVEFVVAYMMPIVASSYIMNADELSAVLAVAVISLTNLLKKKKTQSILTLPRAPARVASTDAPGSTQDVKRGLNKEWN